MCHVYIRTCWPPVSDGTQLQVRLILQKPRNRWVACGTRSISTCQTQTLYAFMRSSGWFLKESKAIE